MLNTSTQKNRGDTIVEALIALAIAAFAVGIAYTTANRSLQQAITARERNQALNLIQNQVTDLRIRYGGDTALNFKINFASHNHYCLEDKGATVGDAFWALHQNNSSPPLATTLRGSNNPYDNKCQINIPGEGATFYIDITTNPLGINPNINDTVFQVFVRWERVGGGPINQASLFYRPNGNVN